METSTKKSSMKAKTMSELLPSLTGLLSKEAMVTLTAKKQPRTTTAHTLTNEKVFKPMTLAEMRAELQVLNTQSPRRVNQPVQSMKKRGWNSSVKVEKKLVSHTADGQFKNNPVRKVLNFKPKPKPVSNPKPRCTTQNIETPKFPVPEHRAKKSLYHLQAQNSVRISGINNIPPTPIITKPAITKGRMTPAGKENIPQKVNLIKKTLAPPTPKIFPPSKTHLQNTPLLNSSWKSGSDASFLQKEKEIHDIEEKVKGMVEEETLENIAEVSPPVSTPFKEYRSVQEYFNHSSCLENSAMCNDNTIMCFDKPSVCHDEHSNGKKEESVIVSLCDLLNKATVTNMDKSTTELDSLLEEERQTEKNIRMLDQGIKVLTNIKESQIKSLKKIKLLLEKKRKNSGIDKDKTLEANIEDVNKTLNSDKSPIISRPCSVIKSRKSSGSPSYKIPSKTCLRKNAVCKSMPNVSLGMQTPVKGFDGRALNMYMEMKEKMNFLSTPMVNREVGIPDTPALTSHNLQKQLDKLFGS